MLLNRSKKTAVKVEVGDGEGTAVEQEYLKIEGKWVMRSRIPQQAGLEVGFKQIGTASTKSSASTKPRKEENTLAQGKRYNTIANQELLGKVERTM